MTSQQSPFGMAVAPQGAVILAGAHGSLGSPTDWRERADAPRSDPHAQAAELWRQAVHDLRGQLGVVTAVTALLQKPRSDIRRLALMAVLDRNVTGLRDLLNGVADLARLDTQQEQPVIGPIDIAAALTDLGNNLRAMASSRGLWLEVSGPASLIAESDTLMLARIAQNLMLNATQYTQAAGVVLTYGLCDGAAPGHWFFEIGDAGHELHGGALRVMRTPAFPIRAASTGGEGIGLSIVSRLCRLLGGTMETRGTAGAGRSTRVRLPQRHFVAPEALTMGPVGHRGGVAIGAWAPAALQGGPARQSPLSSSLPAKPARFST